MNNIYKETSMTGIKIGKMLNKNNQNDREINEE